MNRYKRRRYSRPPKDAEPVKGKEGVYWMGFVPSLRGATIRLRGFWLHPTKGWRSARGEK